MTETPAAIGKPYGIRLAACTSLIAAVCYLSVDGHHTFKMNLLFPGKAIAADCFAEVEDNITWLHGWPIVFYVRNSLDIAKYNATNTSPATTPRDPAFQFGSWPFDNSPTLGYSRVGLVLNAAILIALTFGLWAALSRYNMPSIRFRLRTMLVWMSVIAIPIAFKLLESRYVHMFLALGIVACSIAFVAWTFFRICRSHMSARRVLH